MADIKVVLGTGFKSSGYANPNSIELSEGDYIEFIASDASFKVLFFNAKDCLENAVKDIEDQDIYIGTSKKIGPFKSIPPDECKYLVERTDLDISTGKAPAKMTVKAIITRNG